MCLFYLLIVERLVEGGDDVVDCFGKKEEEFL